MTDLVRSYLFRTPMPRFLVLKPANLLVVAAEASGTRHKVMRSSFGDIHSQRVSHTLVVEIEVNTV